MKDITKGQKLFCVFWLDFCFQFWISVLPECDHHKGCQRMSQRGKVRRKNFFRKHLLMKWNLSGTTLIRFLIRKSFSKRSGCGFFDKSFHRFVTQGVSFIAQYHEREETCRMEFGCTTWVKLWLSNFLSPPLCVNHLQYVSPVMTSTSNLSTFIYVT